MTSYIDSKFRGCNIGYIFIVILLSVLFVPVDVFADSQTSVSTKQEEKAQVIPSAIPKVWLGIQFDTITKEMKLEKTDGALAVKVFPNSPAEKVGVKSGDIVIEANGKKIITGMDIPKMVKTLSPGDIVSLKIYREGKETVYFIYTKSSR